MPLEQLAQTDFSAGGYQGPARNQIPENGLYTPPINLLTDEEGALYKRGGTEYLSNAGFGASLRVLWDGYLSVGKRTLFASPTAWGVLASDGVTPTDLLIGFGADTVFRPVEMKGYLFLGGGAYRVYGGTRKTADYLTGTVSVVAGSKTVTGVGTSWLTNTDAGMLLRVAGGRSLPVASVDTNTQITLRDPYPDVTTTGQAYTLVRFGPAPRSSDAYAVAAGRLIAPGQAAASEGNKVFFSDRNDPFTFQDTSFHELPEGSQITGAYGIRDRALIFTTAGMWTISNMAYDLTDQAGNVQHRLDHAQPDLVLWSNEGIAPWQNGVLVPAVDGLWFVDGVSAPAPFSDNIRDLWTGYVEAGYKTGVAAVYRQHYFLPILDSSNAWVDTLVCHLPRRAWSKLAGHAGQMSAYAGRVGSSPRTPSLLGASLATARVTKVSPIFEPAASRKLDANGTAVLWEFTTRDYQPGLAAVTFRKIRMRYEMVADGSDVPVIGAEYSVPGGSVVALAAPAALAPVSAGAAPFAWTMVAKGRAVRFRIGSSGSYSAASFVLRSVEVFFRQSGKP